jgi:hypothetical protein
VAFRAEAAGTARFYIDQSRLFLDDSRPCDRGGRHAQRIHHKRLGADAEIVAP